MKKLIIALLLSSTVQAQDPLSIQDMQYNLYRSHQEFKSGTLLTLVGVLAIITSMEAKRADMAIPELGYIGGGLITIGTVLHIDSHKWIGRSGKKRFGKRR